MIFSGWSLIGHPNLGGPGEQHAIYGPRPGGDEQPPHTFHGGDGGCHQPHRPAAQELLGAAI